MEQAINRVHSYSGLIGPAFIYAFFFASVSEIQGLLLSHFHREMPENYRSGILMQDPVHDSFRFLNTGKKASVIYVGSTGAYTVLLSALTARSTVKFVRLVPQIWFLTVQQL